MATAATRSECGYFLNELSTCSDERLLILDYDGTLAPFTAHRHRAFPYDGVRDLLNTIQNQCKTRLVIVTGRSAAEIPMLLPLDRSPEIWGVYGIQRIRADGREEVAFVPPAGVQAIADADSWLEELGLGDRIDYKVAAVAVHLRGLPHRAADQVRIECYSKLAQIACAANLTLTEFDGGLELRLKSCDKAHAVNAILAGVDESAPVAFLGDDSTDESAFQAINHRGLSVLVRSTYRSTTARVWLRPPQELLNFLADWAAACGGTH